MDRIPERPANPDPVGLPAFLPRIARRHDPGGMGRGMDATRSVRHAESSPGEPVLPDGLLAGVGVTGYGVARRPRLVRIREAAMHAAGGRSSKTLPVGHDSKSRESKSSFLSFSTSGRIFLLYPSACHTRLLMMNWKRLERQCPWESRSKKAIS